MNVAEVSSGIEVAVEPNMHRAHAERAGATILDRKE
jgi:hypothetical protein